jgi:hypothetical protein
MTARDQRPDPDDEGIPEYAEDTSTAYEQDRPRFEDSPEALPTDHPLAVDEFGVTRAEAREGESLEAALAREEPDVGRVPGPDEAGPSGLDDETGLDHPAPGRPVGRLVEPDEGVREDVDSDMFADDVGAAGGGLSAEEAAMSEVPEESELTDPTELPETPEDQPTEER